MKAVQLIGFGDAVANLELHDVPEPPPPGRGEVLVGVEYAPINFNDLLVAWGFFRFEAELPATIGNEGAGVVLALGEGVTSVAVGDRVVLPLSHTVKNYQQRLIAPAAELVIVPMCADPQQASMMAINPVTAALLLSEYVELKSGDAVVFNSATSGLSQWLMTLAKERGIQTIGLVRKAEDVETVKQRGCDYVIVDGEPLDMARRRFEGLNVRLGLDALGGPSAGRVLQLLSRYGKLVVYGAVTLTPLELPGGAIIGNGLTVDGFSELSPEMMPKVTPTLTNLVKYLGPDGIKQPVAAIYTLDRLKEAVAHAVQGRKVLLQFDGAS